MTEAELAERLALAEDVIKRAQKPLTGLAAYKMETRVRLAPPPKYGAAEAASAAEAAAAEVEGASPDDAVAPELVAAATEAAALLAAEADAALAKK